MNRLNAALLSYILPVVAVIAVAFSYAQYSHASNPKNQLCKHQFALCTSALCVPQPGDPTKAICFCDVEEGASMSTVPCNTIAPSTDVNGIRTVYSTFSLKQFQEGKKGMKCPDGTPWTWCLNKRCTVDPNNSKKAICVCDVVRTGKWMTLGGNCDTSTCKTGYWSAAPLADFADGNAFMTKALGLKESPAKWCPAVQ
jgi:hypothetical protein